MPELKIAIYKGDESAPETVVKIPLQALRIAQSVLPHRVRWAFEEEGIDWKEVIRLVEEEKVSGTLVEVQKKGHRIVVSVEGSESAGSE